MPTIKFQKKQKPHKDWEGYAITVWALIYLGTLLLGVFLLVVSGVAKTISSFFQR